ncbi:MAG: hypothetical protein JWR07_2217 [Nevskia sp.]|nr:hypothetical protein [Nevskia sp.]
MRSGTLGVGAVRWGLAMALLYLAMFAPRAWALDFSFEPLFVHDKVNGVLNTTLTAGVGIRMQNPSEHLISKGDLNPDVCTFPYQSCQGLFRTQTFPAAHLAAAPGSFGANGDRGDLNYGHKGEFFQAPAKVTSDLTLTYGNFGIFARALYFYDFVNNDFTEKHPNEITAQNVNQVGRVGTTLPTLNGLVGGPCSSVAGPLNNLLQPISGLIDPILNGAGLPSLVPNPSAVCGRFYGKGGVVRSKRTDGEVLAQAGTNLQYLDTYFFGKLPLWGDHELTFKIGRQLVNWGESTTLVLNSINSANPVNANNFYRVGNQVEEDFVPVNMIDLGFSPFENFTAEAFYQLEWKPIEAPTPGTYFSDINVGTNNAGKTLNASFGQAAEDPDCLGKLGDNILTGLTPTCITINRVPDLEPRTSGQYGVKLDYYFENLNNGTDVSLYYENYHSRLPYASLFSGYPSCGRAEGNARGNNATDISSLLLDCPNFPLFSSGDPRKATSSALNVQSVRFMLEYPEDIHLIGASFNTTVGSYSIQGEVAYRPNKPMQVDAHDLAFAALGAQGTRCGQAGTSCEGTGLLGALGVGGVGLGPDGQTMTYGQSDAVNSSGRPYTNDTFNLVVGHATGSQRYFPNFIIPYRGGVGGNNTPCYPKPGTAEDAQYGFNTFQHPYYAYDKNSPCYIQGYERMQDFQFNLGATKVLGATDNPIGADQIILVYELGAEYVPFLPSYDQLVLEGPNSTSAPTAGADGSGSDGSRMGCSNIPDCSYGPDGVRFNPHQQDHAGYPRAFSWGYRVIGLLSYEQIVPNVTLKPFILFSQDVGGISPGPAGNFVKGRKLVNMVYEFRYKQALSLSLGYAWYWGGGAYNTLSDRDFAQAFIKYQF